jgi:hypothetical protein
MQLDLKKMPFGQRLSRHLLFEECDPQHKGYDTGLYLALAAESSSMFGGVVSRSAGMAKLTPTLNGDAVAAAARADAAEAVLEFGGKTLRMAIDGRALLLESDGLGLTMQVRLGFGETASDFENGYVLNMGPTRYIIEMRKGKADLQVMWDLTALHSTDPVITLTPENGRLEAVFWDTDSSFARPEIAPNVAAAAEKAEASFAAFREQCCGTNEQYAYTLWLGYQKMRGQELLISNKLSDVKALARGQFLAALAYKEPERVIDAVLAVFALMTPGGMVPAWAKDSAVLPEAAPPLWGLALSRAFARGGMDAAAPEKLSRCYELSKKATEWWLNNRSVGGVCFYAYAYESGWAKNPLPSDSSPQIFPDLCAWMYLNCKTLAELADKLGLKAEAETWRGRASSQLTALKSLWKGGAFVIRNAVSGAEKPCPTENALMTLALGGELPDEIAPTGETDGLPAYIAALGSAERAAALIKRSVENEDAPAAANFAPELCALALALEERK